jgi:hypothetical protein
VQQAVQRCFFFHGPIVDGGTIHRFCRSWPRQVDDWRLSKLNRITVHRVLLRVAEPIGRATTRGRPWLWRLRNTAP